MGEKARCWVYHETKDPLIVDQDDAQDFYDDGWADTPAAFKSRVEAFGADLNDSLQVQQVGEAIEGVKDMANGALNLSEMDNLELVEYALKHFGTKLKKRDGKKRNLRAVEKLIGA